MYNHEMISHDVDLRWQRNVEYFLRIYECNCFMTGPSIAFEFKGAEYQLDKLGDRTRVTIHKGIEPYKTKAVLFKALSMLTPMNIKNYSIQAWVSQDSIWISTFIFSDQNAEAWVDTSNILTRLINIASRG